jgi:hypothetical protein
VNPSRFDNPLAKDNQSLPKEQKSDKIAAALDACYMAFW